MAFVLPRTLGMSVKSAGLLMSLTLTITVCSGNQWDPHVYPQQGPFFEGWYQRIIDPSQNVSIGFLFGSVLPERDTTNLDKLSKLCVSAGLQPMKTICDRMHSKLQYPSLSPAKFTRGPYQNTTSSLPLVFVGLLLSLDSEAKLDNPTGFFSPSEYSVTKNGKPVTRNPDDKTPPQFEVTIAKNVSYFVYPTGANFSVTIGEHSLHAEISAPYPWGPNGEGPESWLEKLPLPLHWFVYSLGSQVKFYEYTNMQTGQKVKGGSTEDMPVVTHFEKDWGKSFPKAWVWIEGVDPKKNISFAASSGLLTELGIDIKAQLSGYRNPSKSIDCSFSPANSVHTLTHDGCQGWMMLKVEGIDCSVVFHLVAPPETFSFCLQAPMTRGFRKGCIESYSAVANITVYERSGIHYKLVDHQIVHQAALEFGEDYMCNGRCPSE